MTDTIERRALRAEVLEHEGRVVFWPVLVDQPSEPIAGAFVEEIAPSAVVKTLREGGNVSADFAHDGSQILGSTAAGTLTLVADKRGIKAEVLLPPTQVGRDVATLVKRGDVAAASFTFVAIAESWRHGDPFPIRRITEMRLLGVSLLGQTPAYPGTTGLVTISERALSRAEELRGLTTLRRDGSRERRRVELEERIRAMEDAGMRTGRPLAIGTATRGLSRGDREVPFSPRDTAWRLIFLDREPGGASRTHDLLVRAELARVEARADEDTERRERGPLSWFHR